MTLQDDLNQLARDDQTVASASAAFDDMATRLASKARVTQPELTLAHLGYTARQIAKTLVAAGIRGRRQSMGHDPVANYLRRHGYTPVAIFVNETGDGLTINAGVWVDIAAPPAVVEFVRGFDDGEYPGLEES